MRLRRTFLTRPPRAAKTALSPVGTSQGDGRPRTTPGPGRVSAGRGRAGEKGIVFSILLGFGAAETRIAIARFWRQFEAAIGEKIFRQVGPRSTAEHFELSLFRSLRIVFR